jgi:plasmid stabilization system protein ParE
VGASIAAALLERIRSHVSMLAETPGILGVGRPEILDGIRSFPSPDDDDALQVVRVLHERQDVNRHLDGAES